MEFLRDLWAYYEGEEEILVASPHPGAAAACLADRFHQRIRSFPAHAVKYVLEEAGTDGSDLLAVVFYEKPLIKFERLLETYHAFAPRGLGSFLTAIPVWIREKLFMKKMLREELRKVCNGEPLLLFPEHHLSHAASAFFPSPRPSWKKISRSISGWTGLRRTCCWWCR